jgi:DNA repair photolyase
MEPVSGFCDSFIPFFANRPEMTLEIRTKSTQVRKLLEFDPLPNCVVAMSFTPEAAAKRWEHRVPAITKRLLAMRKLQQAGWPVAIRFEPVIAEARGRKQLCALVSAGVFNPQWRAYALRKPRRVQAANRFSQEDGQALPRGRSAGARNNLQ